MTNHSEAFYESVAERFNEIGYSTMMADSDPESYRRFLNGELVMVVHEKEDGTTYKMVKKSRY